MTKKNCRILIVHPYRDVDMNPTMLLLLDHLAATKNYDVDIILERRQDGSVPSLGFGCKVIPAPCTFFSSIIEGRSNLIRRILRTVYRCHNPKDIVRAFPEWFGFFSRNRYDMIIGTDTVGIIAAHIIKGNRRIPLFYISFEILFKDECHLPAQTRLLERERTACAAVRKFLIQDEERMNFLCHEKDLRPEDAIMVPVSPPPATIKKSKILHDMLGIDHGKKVVLYVGYLAAWAGRDDFMEMVSYWPDEYCLVLHVRNALQPNVQRYLEFMQSSGKVVVSAHTLPVDQYLPFIASADYALAPYKPVYDSLLDGKNMYHIGYSSGKVAYYAMCGVPILARSLPTFEREFPIYHCGKIYSRLSETGDLLREMGRHYQDFSKGSRDYYNTRLNPMAGIGSFVDAVTADIVSSNPNG